MARSRPAPRHESRQVALQVLYAIDLASRVRSGARPSSDEIFEGIAANFDLREGARAFAKELVCGAVEHGERIDAELSKHAVNWRLSRMAAVDRNVLRLATHELLHTDTPTSVVLDEAIELARQFGAEPSPSFVNGVLDAVARAVRGTSAPPSVRGDDAARAARGATAGKEPRGGIERPPSGA